VLLRGAAGGRGDALVHFMWDTRRKREKKLENFVVTAFRLTRQFGWNGSETKRNIF
jgi:hypothetical protein